MPFRKDHLQLVTDAGATLDIGWAYGTPYSLDPINGVDVDVQTAQGVNQVGVSVERQSVAGVSRELIIHCHSSHGDADAELLLEKLPYFTSGTMYFEDKFFCRFVLSKTPYTKSIHPYPVLDGSPPHGRGKEAQDRAFAAARRITPAWAGKRLLTLSTSGFIGDHPRVGGEKSQSS